jgi:predicted double-glycine peptidase
MAMLKIKPFQETLFRSYCGPAALKILLSYYGVEKSEKELAKLCGTRKELGTDGQGIKRVAESLGLKVKIKNYGNFEDIAGWLNKGVPVIVNWFTRGRADYPDSETADGHYSVAAGLDGKFIYLQDPELGKMRKIKRADFMRVWFDFKGAYLKKDELIIRQLIAIYPRK